MAKGPNGVVEQPVDLQKVQAAERWIDDQITNEATVVWVAEAQIEAQAGDLSDAEWGELASRYRVSGWKVVEFHKFLQRDEGFFHLGM